MSDHFFGFDTAMPTLGAGKDLENEFLTAEIEDEEIDALNEETFGNDVEYFDWEENHEKFAQEERYLQNAIKSTPNRNYYSNQNQTLDSGYETERKLPSHEEIMEQSISQLVLDDELDDPAIMNITKSKPIPTMRQHRRSLNSSPPGLLGTEQLVSPAQTNIWGSPTGISLSNELHSLLRSLKSANNSELSFQDPSIVCASPLLTSGFHNRKLSSCSLPNAKTVDEIESVLSFNKKSAKTLEEVERDILLKPKARTVNEIERELTGYASPSISPILNGPLVQMPIGTPPQGFTVGQSTSHSGCMTPLSVMSGERMTPPSHSFGIPIPNIPLGMHSPSPPLSVRTPSPPPLPSIPIISPNISPFVSWMVPPFQRGAVPPMLGHVLNNQMGIRGPMGRGGRISPPNLVPYVITPRVPVPIPFNDPTSFQGRRNVFTPNQSRFPVYNSLNRPRLNQPFRNFSDSGDYRSYNNQLSHHLNHVNHSDVDYNNQCPQMKHSDDDDEEDEYAGLMTQKEKDWLVKIQLLQLQSNNPYLDDFYYTTYMLKNITKDKSPKVEGIVLENKSEEPTLLLPQRGQNDTKTYKPVQFENSLGKLQVASVNYPRKMIDVDPLISAEEEESKTNASREFKKHRQLLLDIEKLYSLLLELDDIEKKLLALPEVARNFLYQTRRSSTKQLFNGLSCQNSGCDKFVQIMAVRKGKLLVVRSLSHFSKEYIHYILLALFKNLAYIIKKDSQTEVLPQFYLPASIAIKSANLSTLVDYGRQLQNKLDETSPVHHRSNFVQAFQNKFGVSIICCMISRAESLYAEDLWELDNEEQTHWGKVILHLCDIIALVPTSYLIKPLENFKPLLAHFQRFPIERTKFDILEEKLNYLQSDYCS